jgi:integrase
MARKIRAGDRRLMSRTARETLKPNRKPYYRLIERGISLGYRKPIKGPGTWVVRRYIGDEKYSVRNLTTADGHPVFADDHENANAKNVLNFGQAQDALRSRKNQSAGVGGVYTVANALTDYYAAVEAEHRSTHDARTRANAFILPKLGKVKVTALTTKQLTKWRNDLAAVGARLRTREGEEQKYREANGDDAKRARRASANRTWSILRAALNLAFKHEEVPSDAAWRKVKPFKDVDAARPRYLTVEESRRLINACEGDFRQLVQGALTTGARYGQLAGLKVADFHRNVGTVDLRTRKGDGTERVHSCVLTDEGKTLFGQLTAGRSRDEFIFRKADGTAWSKNDHTRLMATAVKAGKIKPAISIHGLRHTWASLSVLAGMPLLVVAKNLGHADTRMAERHYGHLAPSFIADAIRQAAPTFGLKAGNVQIMRSTQ